MEVCSPFLYIVVPSSPPVCLAVSSSPQNDCGYPAKNSAYFYSPGGGDNLVYSPGGRDNLVYSPAD